LRHLQRFRKSEISAISIAAPGLIGPDGTILRCGKLPWKNFSLKQLLMPYFPCHIFVENDANLGGLGETQSLSPIPPLVLYLTISTGIGSGIITDGRLNPTLSNSEAGHMVLPTMNGPQVWQDFASGSAIKKHFQHLAADIRDLEDWEEIVDNLALGLEVLIPALQPNIVIMGGSIGEYYERFGPLLCTVLRQRLPSYIDLPEIRQAAHVAEAVLYGCYHYAIHQISPHQTN
jgi:predicted NBD/HSP70 family sugar kinase